MKIALIGDIHGVIDEFKELVTTLENYSLDEIWCLGDLVDRGPDSGAVIQLCREKGINSVLGNHDSSILSWRKRFLKEGTIPQNPDKATTLKQLNLDDFKYLEGLPKLHIIDPLKLILVHGGIWPALDWHKQPDSIVRLQSINPKTMQTRWWGFDAHLHKCKKTEEESRLEGYNRWYELYDHEYTVIYGHSGFNAPLTYGNTIGIDTRSCFGGSLTACIWDNINKPEFISIKAKKIYAQHDLNED